MTAPKKANKGIAAKKKAQKREQAEKRNAKYQSLSLGEKKARNSKKVIKKLESKDGAL